MFNIIYICACMIKYKRVKYLYMYLDQNFIFSCSRFSLCNKPLLWGQIVQHFQTKLHWRGVRFKFIYSREKLKKKWKNEFQKKMLFLLGRVWCVELQNSGILSKLLTGDKVGDQASTLELPNWGWTLILLLWLIWIHKKKIVFLVDWAIESCKYINWSLVMDHGQSFPEQPVMEL